MTKSPIYRYGGSEVDVTWDERLCIHVGECGRAKGELFVSGREPWCRPDGCSVAHVAEVVERCPSGALAYEAKDGTTAETAAPRNTVAVSANGPYFVRGNLAIDGAAADMPAVRYRAALCRCGQSRNKPFCDTSHEAAGFKDYGAVGEVGAAARAEGGALAVKPVKNGPLHLKGNFSIIAGSGLVRWRGTEAWLCRCGHSGNKPFCDGSHRKFGFAAD